MTKAKTVAKAQVSKSLKAAKPSAVEPAPTTKITRKVFQIDTGDAPVTKADLAAVVAAVQSGSQLIELSPAAIEKIAKAAGNRMQNAGIDDFSPKEAVTQEVLSPVARESSDLDNELAAMQQALAELTVRLKPVLPHYDDPEDSLVAEDSDGVPSHNMHEPTRVAAIQQLRRKRQEVQRMRADLEYLLKNIAV